MGLGGHHFWSLALVNVDIFWEKSWTHRVSQIDPFF